MDLSALPLSGPFALGDTVQDKARSGQATAAKSTVLSVSGHWRSKFYCSGTIQVTSLVLWTRARRSVHEFKFKVCSAGPGAGSGPQVPHLPVDSRGRMAGSKFEISLTRRTATIRAGTRTTDSAAALALALADSESESDSAFKLDSALDSGTH